MAVSCFSNPKSIKKYYLSFHEYAIIIVSIISDKI